MFSMEAETKVDPRVRGGARNRRLAALACTGRSPRARGSRTRCGGTWACSRSIPACAGEPNVSVAETVVGEVDPRVRGGAPTSTPRATRRAGRSPRARGSLRAGKAAGRDRRSIPACAGEPWSSSTKAKTRRVDPRVRGGALVCLRVSANDLGRSPRARGSPWRPGNCGRSLGSIPACAGEPRRPQKSSTGAGVDPRVRGGAPAPARLRLC